MKIKEPKWEYVKDKGHWRTSIGTFSLYAKDDGCWWCWCRAGDSSQALVNKGNAHYLDAAKVEAFSSMLGYVGLTVENY